MTFDFKKAYREYYMPGRKPELVVVPPMNYIAVEGQGDPNVEDGAYARALSVLYAVAYTIRMSKKGDRPIQGYFDYLVPPLEGFWWQPGIEGVNYADKAGFHWLSVLRLPDFVTREDFDWAVSEASRKKKLDCSMARFVTIDEGLCVQLMHLGAYDDEPASVALMDAFVAKNGLANDLSDARRHHEIYLSDPRKAAPKKLKTVIRHPVRRA